MFKPIFILLSFSLYFCLQLSGISARAIYENKRYIPSSPSIVARQGSGQLQGNIKALLLHEITYSFLFQRMRENTRVFQDQTLLFYSRRNGPYDARRGGLSDSAISRANSRGWRTIWHGWPGAPAANQYANSDTSYYGITNEQGILREIRYRFRNNPPEQVPETSTQTQYFRRMSAAFALQARGQVVFMTENPGVPRMDGIWGQTEFPILRGETYTDPANGERHTNPHVNRVYATDEALHEWYIIWDRRDRSITPENPRHLPNGEPALPPHRAGTAQPEIDPPIKEPKDKRQACQLDENGVCQGIFNNDPQMIEGGEGRFFMDFFG